MESEGNKVKERWKSIQGTEKYEVSNLGRVRSTSRCITRQKCGTSYTFFWKGRILKHGITEGGYHQCARDYVHRLVWEAFVGPIPKGLEVNHLDGNKSNNRLDNLEIGTRKQNMEHAIRTGLTKCIGAKGENNHSSKMTKKEVNRMRRLYNAGIRPKALSEEFGVTRATVWQIVTWKTWRD